MGFTAFLSGFPLFCELRGGLAWDVLDFLTQDFCELRGELAWDVLDFLTQDFC